jgi:hypothetical protein
MTIKSDIDRERQQHQRIVKQLAEEMQVAEERVVAAYEVELQQLKESARVSQFLSVIAAKHVKTRLSRAGRT